MICAKPGWGPPQPGQTVYVVTEKGVPVGACLHYPRATIEFSHLEDPGLVEVVWLEEYEFYGVTAQAPDLGK